MQLLSVLVKAGFKILRQKGSHLRLMHPLTKRSTTVAVHAKDLSKKMLGKIIKQSGLTIEEFLKYLKK